MNISEHMPDLQAAIELLGALVSLAAAGFKLRNQVALQRRDGEPLKGNATPPGDSGCRANESMEPLTVRSSPAPGAGPRRKHTRFAFALDIVHDA